MFELAQEAGHRVQCVLVIVHQQNTHRLGTGGHRLGRWWIGGEGFRAVLPATAPPAADVRPVAGAPSINLAAAALAAPPVQVLAAFTAAAQQIAPYLDTTGLEMFGVAPLREAIGQALRRVRTEQRRTLKDVAGVAGVSMQYLSEVERGRKEASSEILEAVCASLRKVTKSSAWSCNPAAKAAAQNCSIAARPRMTPCPGGASTAFGR